MIHPIDATRTLQDRLAPLAELAWLVREANERDFDFEMTLPFSYDIARSITELQADITNVVNVVGKWCEKKGVT